MKRQRRTAEDWRRAVYRSTTLSDRTKVLLLFMADHMREDRKVSIPRDRIAAALGRSERRITERITEAHDSGWLSTVVRGQKGITAVYQGLFPDSLSGTDARPLNRRPSKFSGTPTSPLNDAETRPLNEPNQAFSGTHGGPTITRADLSASPHGRDGGSNEETEDQPRRGRLTVCRWQHAICPDDCADHPSTREESA